MCITHDFTCLSHPQTTKKERESAAGVKHSHQGSYSSMFPFKAKKISTPKSVINHISGIEPEAEEQKFLRAPT